MSGNDKATITSTATTTGGAGAGEALGRAVATTLRIRDALAAEVARAQDERVLIRSMDVDGLMRRASLRAEFNQATAALQQELAAALGQAGAALALPEITLARIQAAAAEPGAALAAALAEVRALAGALAELDALNRLLGQRALSYVKAHLAVLSPKTSAYDRRGGAGSAAPRTSTVVRVV
jgi:hypothetical protein